MHDVRVSRCVKTRSSLTVCSSKPSTFCSHIRDSTHTRGRHVDELLAAIRRGEIVVQCTVSGERINPSSHDRTYFYCGKDTLLHTNQDKRHLSFSTSSPLTRTKVTTVQTKSNPLNPPRNRIRLVDHTLKHARDGKRISSP